MSAFEAFVRSITPNTQDEFPGCDAGDPGSPESPSIWLFGVEPGHAITDDSHPPITDSDYTVDSQLQWPFNRNAFKLISLIEGQTLENHRNYARQQRIFQNNCSGYFKGNLFPVGVQSVATWTDELIYRTGFQTKANYYDWCRQNHFPRIREWALKHKPKLIIGCGVSFLNDFATAFLGEPIKPIQKQIKSGYRVRNMYVFNGTPLVVVPHLSGGPSGLTSHESIIRAAELIRAEHP